MTPKLFSHKIIYNLVKNKKSHLLSAYHEILLYDNFFKEYFKREYKYEECKEKIQKYYNYYKYYLNYFCNPTLVDYFPNQIIAQNKYKIAQTFYYQKYLINKNSKPENDIYNINKKGIIFFNKKVIRDIENSSIENNLEETKENLIISNNNNNLEMTSFSFSEDKKNNSTINLSKCLNKNKDDSQNNSLNYEQIIQNTNFGYNIMKIIETNNSLKTLINEIDENNKINKNINKEQNNNNNYINPVYNKNIINNLNINLNQLIINNNKIINSFQENDKNKDYNRNYFKEKNENQRIFNYLKNILNLDGINQNKKNINKNIFNSNKFSNNCLNKNNMNFKSTIDVNSLSKRNIFPKIFKVNSMTKKLLSPIKKNQIKQRNYSNLKNDKKHKSGFLLELGSGILEYQGKIKLKLKNSNNNNDILGSNRYLYFSKMAKKIGNSVINNNLSNYKKKNFIKIINSDKNIDKIKNNRNSQSYEKLLFKSGFNLSSGRFNSVLNTPNNSIQIKHDIDNKINNCKININLKDINYINNKDIFLINTKTIEKKILGKKKYIENKKID